MISYCARIGVEDFLLPYFEYRQIWMNNLLDGHHLNNITNLIFLHVAHCYYHKEMAGSYFM
jgi:hypothetical protein